MERGEGSNRGPFLEKVFKIHTEAIQSSATFFSGLCACLVSLTPEPGYVWIQLHQRARGRLPSFTANGAWEGFDLPPDPSPAP